MGWDDGRGGDSGGDLSAAAGLGRLQQHAAGQAFEGLLYLRAQDRRAVTGNVLLLVVWVVAPLLFLALFLFLVFLIIFLFALLLLRVLGAGLAGLLLGRGPVRGWLELIELARVSHTMDAVGYGQITQKRDNLIPASERRKLQSKPNDNKNNNNIFARIKIIDKQNQNEMG